MSFLNNLSNLQQRIVIGILGVAVIVASITYSQWTYLLFMLALSNLTQAEFYTLIKEDGDDPLTRWGLLNGTFLHAITFFVAKDMLPTKAYMVFFVMLGVIFISELYRKTSHPFENIAYTMLGVFYVAMPLALLHFACFSGGIFSPQIAIGIFVLLWSSDTGAYFAGRSLGKTKLFPRISPNKTWEGFIGGVLLTIVSAMVMSIYFEDLSWVKWLSLAIIIPITSTYGDLIESMLKRSLMVKDSSTLLPGHGGLLDRFDGMLFTAPFVSFYLSYF